MHSDKNSPGLRDVVIGVIIIVIGSLIMKYSDLPTTVAVQENRINMLETRFEKFDKKMDAVLERLPLKR